MAAHFPVLMARAAALYAEGKLEAALAALNEAVALDPGAAMAWSHRGAILHALGRAEEALASLDRASALAPTLIEPHLSRGAIFDLQGRFEDAAQAWAMAAALAPGAADLRHRLAIAEGGSGRPREELAAYEAAIALDGANPVLMRNRALALLRLGRYEEGWAAMEARKLHPGATFTPSRGAPWTGEAPAPGRDRLLVFHEEGAGDAIQFVRFVTAAARRGFRITLWVPPVMTDLFRSLPGREAIDVVETEPPQYDLWCGMLSLPWALRVTLEDLPMGEAYLSADPARAKRIEASLPPRGRRPRIGLAWSGRPTNENDAIRSIPFDALAPLLAAGADWHALQNEVRESDRAAFAASGRVAFHGEALRDFADTAALTEQMDLAISVDTSLAHLAGALGKPVWVLLPFAADWRWLTGRDDSPWYPTARLFRQTRRGDWAGVIDRVGEALARRPR